MPKRRLTLHREELTPLDTDQLSSVAGAVSGLALQCLLSLYATCFSRCDCRPFTDTCQPATDIC